MYGKAPAKIVQTIPGSGTLVGPGDVHIDEHGRSWRQLGECEARYASDNGGTSVVVLGTICCGYIR